MMCKTISIQTNQHQELIDITSEIDDEIKSEGIKEGYCIVFVPHTTAAVTINECADPDVKEDMINMLSSLIPKHGSYKHSEGNSDAHIKASLLGSSEYILIKNGGLLLGTWQHVYFFEGDGPRKRSFYLRIIGEQGDKL